MLLCVCYANCPAEVLTRQDETILAPKSIVACHLSKQHLKGQFNSVIQPSLDSCGERKLSFVVYKFWGLKIWNPSW